MSSKALIFGKGFIGTRVQQELSCDMATKRIRSFEDVMQEIEKFNPKIIINCIGYTGENVDQCELDKDKALSANTFLPILLAEAALRQKIKFIHISSGCIYHFNYQNSKPLTEEDMPDFLYLFYSRTKIYSERALTVLSKENNILIWASERGFGRNIMRMVFLCLSLLIGMI